MKCLRRRCGYERALTASVRSAIARRLQDRCDRPPLQPSRSTDPPRLRLSGFARPHWTRRFSCSVMGCYTFWGRGHPYPTGRKFSKRICTQIYETQLGDRCPEWSVLATNCNSNKISSTTNLIKYGCTYPRFWPSFYCFSSSMTAAFASCAFASLVALAISMPKTWIVLWSEVAAIYREWWLKCKSLISALSAPRLKINGQVGLGVSTFQIRIRVPFSLAVANRSPCLLRAIAAMDP